MATVLERLNSALMTVMGEEHRVLLLGEDILDPYGGAFKVTKGCSTKFPDRVFTTPISEAAMVGIANGLALAGKLPVVEIMFGDFVTLIADQMLNHGAKFKWMYNDQVNVPIVVRTPMGGRRGYGPTHSQSLEKHFLGVPGLIVLAPNALQDPGELLRKAIIEVKDPVLFIEHKLLYTTQLRDAGSTELTDFEISQNTNEGFPITTLKFKGISKHHCTIATYGYNFEIARKAAIRSAYENEIFCEIVVVSELSAGTYSEIIDSVRRTKRLITFEEGTERSGWGAEVVASTLSQLRQGVAKRVGALDLPIANSHTLEEEILPSETKLMDVITEMSKN